METKEIKDKEKRMSKEEWVNWMAQQKVDNKIIRKVKSQIHRTTAYFVGK